MSMMIMACRRYFVMNSDVSMPTLASTKEIMGSSKISPAERSVMLMNPKYSFISMEFSI